MEPTSDDGAIVAAEPSRAIVIVEPSIAERQETRLVCGNRSLQPATLAGARRAAAVGLAIGLLTTLALIGFLIGLAVEIAMSSSHKGSSAQKAYGPAHNASTFCETVPCVRGADGTLLFTQPVGTSVVCVLALEYLVAGVHVLVRSVQDGAWADKHYLCSCWHAPTGALDGKARAWWGYAFIVWGVSVVLAGISFQAFTFHVRCTGDPFGDATCRLEAADSIAQAYYILQNAGSNLFVVARSYRGARRLTVAAKCFAFTSTLVYGLCILCWPATRQYVISGLFMLPSYILMMTVFVLAGLQDVALFVAWIMLGVAFVWYIVWGNWVPYEDWWRSSGVYFSENDALHVGLLPFVIAAWSSAKEVHDAPARMWSDEGGGYFERWVKHVALRMTNERFEQWATSVRQSVRSPKEIGSPMRRGAEIKVNSEL